MADEEHGPSLLRGTPHSPETLPLKGGVADSQHLVDQEDLGLEMRRHREGQSQIHAARIALHRRIDEALNFGERDDLVEAACDTRAIQSQDRPVEIDVVPAGELGMETGADLQERPDASANLGVPGGGVGDAREQLQQRALA